MEKIWVGWVLLGVGVWAVIDGIRVRLGVSRSWFYVHRTPTIVMPNMVFGSIPFGAGIASMGLMLVLRFYGWIGTQITWFVIYGLMGPCFVLGAVFWLWKPSFVQPDWYRWLDEHYGSIMPVLKKDAERLGKAWLDRVRTQEGLERWAEEVRQRQQAGTLPK